MNKTGGFNASTWTLTVPTQDMNLVISRHVIYRGNSIEAWMLFASIAGCAIVQGAIALVGAIRNQ